MPKKILIVDDEQLFLEGLSRALYKFCDFQGKVKTVGNGKDAIKEISRCFYDICFLDINLPDLNGMEVMKKIKEMSPRTSIAIMTACVIDDGMKRTIKEDASLFIDKPINLPKIRAFLKQVLIEGVKGERRQSERKALMKTLNYSIYIITPV